MSTKTNNFAPPLAGPVLNALLAAFELRRWDRADVLSQKTSRRYLAGDRVGEDAEWRVHRAVASAIVASDLVPAAFSVPEIPVKPEEALAVFLHAHAKQWDQLAGAMRRMSAPVEHHRPAAAAYLRLVVIDIAVRIGALLWLLRGPDGQLPPPIWAEPRGAGMLLRSMLERCGDRKPTRDQIAIELGTDFKTVDGWLDGQSRPGDGNVARFAKLLSVRGAGEEAELARQIRLMFSLEAMAKLVSSIVGEERVMDMAVRLIGYANEFPNFLRRNTSPRHMLEEVLRLTFLGGTLQVDPSLPNFLKHVWRNERDPVWRTDLMAVTGPWLHRVQDVAIKLGPIDSATMQRELGYVPSDEVLEHILYMIQASKDEQMCNPLYRGVATQLMEDPAFASREHQTASLEAFRSGDLLKAVGHAREAVRLVPDDAGNHFRLGALLWQLGDFAEGLVECEIAAQMAPGWDRPRVEAALVLLNQGREQEALQRLETAKRELSEPTPWLLFFLGFARERNGDIEGAIGAYEELLALTPEDGEALDRLAHLYFVTGDTKAAIDRCKRANHLGFPTVFRAWEQGYYKKGRPTERPPQVLPQSMVRVPDRFWFEKDKR